MATPPPYQQQNPYQQQPPAYGYAAPGAAPAPVFAGPSCRMCGGFPAAEATVRQHQGILIMMRFLHVRGPFCRNCGLAVVRDMTGKTLWQGWWSPVSLVIFTPFTLIWNMVVKSKLEKLPPPMMPGQQQPQPWQ
ncbi:hypothetical protein ABZY03_28525 [Streptomyces klenkii]|uniref:hypothetical protein n=1 Tax=Streptomyces klenkii TaxID=1420899 RepID=UPI0033BC7367